MSIKICLYSVTYFRVSQARMLMLRSYIKPKQCNRQKLKHATLVFVLHLITNESFQLAYFLVYLSRISDGLNEKTTKQITNVSPRPTFKLKHSAGTYPTIDQKHRSFIFGLCLEINTCITDSDKPTSCLSPFHPSVHYFQCSICWLSAFDTNGSLELQKKTGTAGHILLSQCVKH